MGNATECWRLLFSLVDDFREEASHRNEPSREFSNVTVGQMRVMKAIFSFQDKYPDGVMLKLLAEKVNLTPGAASIIVDSLVKQGVIDRRTSDVDRRAVCICLSDEGKQIVAYYCNFFTKITAEFLEEITEEEYDVFMKVMNKFNDKIARCKDEVQ